MKVIHMDLKEKVEKIKQELETDKLSVFDIEVFKYNYLIVVFDLCKLSIHTYWENQFEDFLSNVQSSENIMVGFNNKNYDDPVICAMKNVEDCATIKNISDRIVNGEMSWEIEECRGYPLYNRCDLRDDCYVGVSLKGFEAHMGMDIVESRVDFDVDHPLSDEEKADVEYYCIKDVEATIHMMYERIGYLGTKIRLGRLKNISTEEALNMTNAKLTARYLNAKKQPHNDKYNYKFPDNVKYEYIEEGVISFFKTIKAGDLELEDKAKSYISHIGSCEYKVGAGGIHGCNGVYNDTSDDTHSIINVDVNQFYPSMIVINGYLSRNVPNPDDYKQVTVQRAKYKKEGNKKAAGDLKLVNNTTFGASKNQYNDLYDPLMALSICLSGQLYLLELATHLYRDTGCELIQLNTDGIMFKIENSKMCIMRDILTEWQTRTGFELEEDNINLIIQRDVNNYIERQVNGSVKVKGGALVRGISYVGAFKINNNATIIPDAVKAWFLEGISPEETINNCNDIFKFQIISKVGSKYKRSFQLQFVDGEIVYVPVQKCNRVYATSNQMLGTLYKQKEDGATMERVASLPENCIVDNSNKLTIDEVNKSWYIKEAKKIINDFTQTKEKELTIMSKVTNEPEAAVADVSTMNIYSKLIAARADFQKENISPSGYNAHADFDYLELSDIVPVATRIFERYHLVLLVRFEEGKCLGTLIDTDKPDNRIVFVLPHKQIAEPGKYRMNEVQALGSEITYLRRYMYQVVLDIVIADEIDAGKVEEAPSVKPSVKSKTPEPKKEAPKAKIVTSATRTEMKQQITDADGMADELQIKALRQLLGDWLKADPNAKAEANAIFVKSNGFKKTTRTEAEGIIADIKKRIEAAKQGKE